MNNKKRDLHRTLHSFFITWAIPSLMALVLCSCMGNSGKFTPNRNVAGATATSNNLAPILIDLVLKTSSSPDDSFDVLGDGSGAIGKYCSPVGTCKCVYDFTNPSGVHVVTESESTYVEANLMRCNYSGSGGIPSGTKSVQVSIKIIASQLASAPALFDFVADSGGLVAEQFFKVNRWQCKDAPFIPYMLDNKMYDPIQTDDPWTNIPLNFFTANKAKAMLYFASNKTSLPDAKGAGWICPDSNADPSWFVRVPGLPINTLLLGAVDQTANLDYRIYSIDAHPNIQNTATGKLLYPPQDGFHDHTKFFLAKKPVGDFQFPVNAIVAPNLLSAKATTNGTSTAPPPIGYGIPVSGESCPASDKPPGYEFVKVWLFRASVAPRHYVTSPRFVSRVEEIKCSPGAILDSKGTAIPVFKDCADSVNKDLAIDYNPSNPSYPFYDRVLSMGSISSGSDVGVCVRMSGLGTPIFPSYSSSDSAYWMNLLTMCANTGFTGPGCTTNANGTMTTSAYSRMAPGTDVWQLRRRNLGISCGGGDSTDNDFVNLCKQPDPSNPSVPPVARDFDKSTPTSPDPMPPTLIELDTRNVSRFDYLFVVTDANVTSDQIRNTNTYKPYRFYRPGTCIAADPDAAISNPDCGANNRMTYDVVLNDMSAPGFTNIFPICALRKAGE